MLRASTTYERAFCQVVDALFHGSWSKACKGSLQQPLPSHIATQSLTFLVKRSHTNHADGQQMKSAQNSKAGSASSYVLGSCRCSQLHVKPSDKAGRGGQAATHLLSCHQHLKLSNFLNSHNRTWALLFKVVVKIVTIHQGELQPSMLIIRPALVSAVMM